MNLRAMRWLDVMAVIGIAIVMLGMTIAARQNVQQAEDIARCAQHLEQIRNSLLQYQQDHGTFPRTRYEPDQPISAFTRPNAADPFGKDGPEANDVTAAAFLLARTQKLPATIFNCPAALRNGLAEKDSFKDNTVMARSNFQARINYNYSLANMYPGQGLRDAGYALEKAEQMFVIAADTNPGGEAVHTAVPSMSLRELRMTNSPNHQRDGQNVLYADGRVQFVPTAFVGVPVANIYASGANSVFPQPADPTDVVLLPTWSMGPDKTPFALTVRRWVFVGVAIGSTLLLVFIVLRGRFRASSSNTPPVAQ